MTSAGLVVGGARPGLSAPEREWWQRLAGAWRVWAQGHEVALRRLRVMRAVGLWLSLAWLLVMVVVRPELRESLRVFGHVYWLLLVWFLLTRTRTVSWRLVAALFSAGVLWSAVVGRLLYEMAQAVGARDFGSLVVPGNVRGLGPMAALAGVGEESLKLLPLALLVVAAPGRARRFAVTDWLLLGFAAGLAFQAFEELARRTAVNVLRPGLSSVIHGVDNRGPETGYPQYGWGPAAGWSEWEPGTQFPGHHATTALVAVTVGLAVAAWRHAGRRRGRAAIGWRALAVVAPPVMWWIVVSVHAGGNATVLVGDKWLTAENPSVPWLIRAGWQVGNHGVGLRWLLLLLLLVALLVDARHLHRGDRARADGGVLPLPFDPAARAGTWTRRVAGSAAGPWRALVGAVCALAAYATRDVAVLAAAHARQPGESRRLAAVRGRAATGLLRATREETLAQAAGPATRGDRLRGRLLGSVAVLALVVTTFWLGPAWARRIGAGPSLEALAGDAGHTVTWLAGLLDALAGWWDGQSTGSKIAIGVGIAALVALSGGSLGLAFGVSGVATYLLAHGRGAADLVRDPGAATRSYLATATPTGVLADGAEAVLTFAPGNFAGAAAGRGVRLAAEDFARDPQAWLATRRALAHDDTGAVNLGAFYRREPIELADGTTWTPVNPADRGAFTQWWDNAPAGPVRASGPEGAYQVRLYGDTERRVLGNPETWADGATPDYGAVADAKYRAKARSFYDPTSLDPRMRPWAIADMDHRLGKYAAVIEDPNSPAKVLEISTNDPGVAAFVEERMRVLGIPGYVRLEP